MDEGGSMECLSLKRLHGGSLERGSSFTGDPGRYAKSLQIWASLSMEALSSQREPGMWRGGPHTPGILIDE